MREAIERNLSEECHGRPLAASGQLNRYGRCSQRTSTEELCRTGDDRRIRTYPHSCADPAKPGGQHGQLIGVTPLRDAPRAGFEHSLTVRSECHLRVHAYGEAPHRAVYLREDRDETEPTMNIDTVTPSHPTTMRAARDVAREWREGLLQDLVAVSIIVRTVRGHLTTDGEAVRLLDAASGTLDASLEIMRAALQWEVELGTVPRSVFSAPAATRVA